MVWLSFDDLVQLRLCCKATLFFLEGQFPSLRKHEYLKLSLKPIHVSLRMRDWLALQFGLDHGLLDVNLRNLPDSAGKPWPSALSLREIRSVSKKVIVSWLLFFSLAVLYPVHSDMILQWGQVVEYCRHFAADKTLLRVRPAPGAVRDDEPGRGYYGAHKEWTSWEEEFFGKQCHPSDLCVMAMVRPGALQTVYTFESSSFSTA